MRNEKGSITLFVLVSMLFFLIIATTAYVSASSKLQGQNEEIARIKASYEQDLSDDALLQLYNRATKTREWLPGNGTQEDTYKIYTIEDLLTLSMKSNNGDFMNEGTGEVKYIYVELMNDLDFKRDSSYAKANRTDFGDVNDDGTVQDLKTELTTGQGFPCIAATEVNAFTGTFMGNDHEIRNLWINITIGTGRNIGLFGNIGNSIIQDIGTTGNITTTTDNKIGGIVGYVEPNANCTITNCYNSNKVTGIREVGGIVGVLSSGTIDRCDNSASIEGTIENSANGSVGGIVGWADNSSIVQKCKNSGQILGKSNCIGGICGVNNGGTINMCFNQGNVNSTGEYATGGITGYHRISNSKTINCYNIGDTSGEKNVGGICGSAFFGEVKNSYDLGSVTGIGFVGSVIGSMGPDNVSITNCYYLSTLATTDSYAIPKSDTDMKLQAFVDILNSGQLELPWQLDTGINNGYPILKWQTQQ